MRVCMYARTATSRRHFEQRTARGIRRGSCVHGAVPQGLLAHTACVCADCARVATARRRSRAGCSAGMPQNSGNSGPETSRRVGARCLVGRTGRVLPRRVSKPSSGCVWGTKTKKKQTEQWELGQQGSHTAGGRECLPGRTLMANGCLANRGCKLCCCGGRGKR